jgi:MYXO-CTERM domain-containing protein
LTRSGSGATVRVVKLFALLLVTATVATAHADVQRWPFSFDVSLAADPTGTGNAITQGATSLPPLPTTELQTLTVDGGSMTLWVWPESARLLSGIAAAGTTPMAWPTTPTLCVATDAFTIPTLLGPSPSSACTAADASIRAQLMDLSACDLVDRPELYVLGYDASNPQGNTDTLEHLIGLSGEAFAKIGAPPDGVLPPGFVSTLRVVIDKIRHDTLAAQIVTAKSVYASALSTAQASASCFDATALAQLESGIGDLTSELDAASTYLEQLKTTGEGANAQENMCLAAKSLARNAVLYPSLTQAEREFVAFWIGAVYWRMRGGGLIPLGSTQDARLYFLGGGFARIGEIVDQPDAQAIANAFVLQVVIDGWSDYQDMGTGAGADKYSDLVGMTQRGQRQAQAGINVIANAGWDTTDLMAGGLQMGPGYYWGWYGAPGFRYGMVNDTTFTSPPYSSYMDGQTAIGEFNMGGALGLGLAHTLLAGKPTGQAPTVTLCAGRACGDDGCGGSCGTCASGACMDGQCVGASTIDASVAADLASGSPDLASGPGATKAGGCACDVTGHGSAPQLALAIVLLAFVGWLRRRAR